MSWAFDSLCAWRNAILCSVACVCVWIYWGMHKRQTSFNCKCVHTYSCQYKSIVIRMMDSIISIYGNRNDYEDDDNDNDNISPNSAISISIEQHTIKFETYTKLLIFCWQKTCNAMKIRYAFTILIDFLSMYSCLFVVGGVKRDKILKASVFYFVIVCLQNLTNVLIWLINMPFLSKRNILCIYSLSFMSILHTKTTSVFDHNIFVNERMNRFGRDYCEFVFVVADAFSPTVFMQIIQQVC